MTTNLHGLLADHRCDSCTGSGDRLRDEVDPFCEACGYLRETHDPGSGVCPDEAEARERWGK